MTRDNTLGDHELQQTERRRAETHLMPLYDVDMSPRKLLRNK